MIDVNAAREDGFDDNTILQSMVADPEISREFDFESAQKDGFSSTDILNSYNDYIGADIKQQTIAAKASVNVHEWTAEELQNKFSMENIDEEGNVKPLSTEQRLQIHKAQLREKQNTDLGKGIDASVTGIVQTGVDIADALGFDVENLDTATQAQIKTLNDEIKDKDFFSMGNLGKVIPTLVTLPIAYQSKLAAFMIEGALGYAEARGSEATKGEALVSGVIAGGAIAGIMKLIETLGPKAAKGTYEYYKNQLNFTDDEAEAIFADWSKVMETSGSYKDRLRALIDYSGDKGAQIKADLARVSPSAQKTIDQGRADRIRNVKELADTDVVVEDIATKIKDQVKVVQDNYSKVKWEIKNVKAKGEPLQIPDALEEIVTDRKAIQELLGNPNATVQDLIDAMPHINEITRRVKGTNLHKWTQLKDAVDNKLQESLSTAEYSKWLEVNTDYAQMMNVRNSKLGEAAERALGKKGKKSQITPGRVIELIKTDKDSGPQTFESIRHLLGSGDTAKLEQMIIKDALGNHADDLSWETLAKSLNSKGFVSAEGKQFQELIDNIAKSFKTDDVLRTAAARFDSDQGGIGKNILEKFQISLAGRVFRMIMKLGPTEGAKAMRMADRLAKVLRSPSHMKSINKAVSTLGEGVKARMVQETVDELPKMLEYKPTNPRLANATNEPLYVTKGGTAAKGRDVAAAVQAEELTKWIKETKLSDMDGNKVLKSVFNTINNKRINSIMKSTRAKLKADDVAYNMKVVEKIIRNEAKGMANAIAKDSGVKLGKEDSEKLVHYLFTKYVKECK